jgi:hypothetical protein
MRASARGRVGMVTWGHGAEKTRGPEAQGEAVQKCKSACGLCKSAEVWNEKGVGVGAGVGVVSFKGKPETG